MDGSCIQSIMPLGCHEAHEDVASHRDDMTFRSSIDPMNASNLSPLVNRSSKLREAIL
jgi:hypothetical protein